MAIYLRRSLLLFAVMTTRCMTCILWDSIDVQPGRSIILIDVQVKSGKPAPDIYVVAGEASIVVNVDQTVSIWTGFGILIPFIVTGS